MSLVARFLSLCANKGSTVVFHRESFAAGVLCPCRTDEGYRDPQWHIDHPGEPVCNEDGILPVPVEFSFKGFCQPIQATRAAGLSTEQIIQLVGEIQRDDHLGLFPMEWNGNALDFSDWSDSGSDYILYDGQRFTIINVNLIPDPSDGYPRHHQEIGLRLLGERRDDIA